VKGRIGAACHDRLDEMPLMSQAGSVPDEWCLGDSIGIRPKNLRPKEEVFNMTYKPPSSGERGLELQEKFLTTRTELGKAISPSTN